MHELSAAQSIVDILLHSLPTENLPRVRRIKVKVGSVCGVVPDSLSFAFEVLVGDTTLHDARLEIESVPCRVRCNTCGHTAYSELGLALCAACGTLDARILSGTELEVSEVELQDMEEELV